ncbi:MAG TPA: outer membrane beta-barrel protein, partial [Prolixibacteraceae bacterium]
DFSIGWANLGTRFTPVNNELNYSNYDILSPGFELQLSYHYHNNWVITTGANYQTLFFRSPYPRHSYDSPPFVATLSNKDISIPILIKYNFLKTGSSTRVGITTGIYFAFPVYRQETFYSKGNPLPDDDQAYISDYLPYKYSFIYLGCGINKTISPRFEIYAEPFACHILKEVRDGSMATQKYRSNFWYGIKLGINYSFKSRKNEKK